MNLLFGSLRGAPGVTSLAVMLAYYWPNPCILVEGDQSGGVLAARYNLLPNNPGLLNLVTGCKRSMDPKSIHQSTQMLSKRLPVVVSSGRNSTIQGLLSEVAISDINETMTDTDFFFDLGRIESSNCPPNLLVSAEMLVLLVHPNFEQLDPLLTQLTDFTNQAVVGIVIMETWENTKTEYSKSEIDIAVKSVSNGRARVIGVLPYDKRAAQICISEGPGNKTLEKSLLVRSIKDLAAGFIHSKDSGNPKTRRKTPCKNLRPNHQKDSARRPLKKSSRASELIATIGRT